MTEGSKNKNLTAAKKAKNDEFYTQFSDIEKELSHYKQHFAGKTVFCNCDDPTWSNFWRYFHLNFEFFGLKKLIATHYDATQSTYMMTYEGGDDTNLEAGVMTPLKQNGDFRSPECVELLKEADIVVTNEPFSLFRPYIAQLMENEKKFVIIGNMNAITYKEFFPLIKENKVWLGYTSPKVFIQPDGSEKKMGNVVWYTNLDIDKRHEPIDLVEKYTPEKYPKYDNYDAINVDKTLDIPCDYDGVMGVPISFLDKYCPEQFKILNANDFRVNDSIPVKTHGLIKDKEAAITERESTHLLCQSAYQTCCHQGLMDGILVENVNTHEFSYGSYEDMVSRPILDGNKVYRRIFIRRK